MQTILGPFQPHLENALVQEILQYKGADLLCPLLIVAPSDALLRHLKIMLARQRHLSLVNVHLLTFHQLTARLFSEINGADRSHLRDDLFFEEVLRQLIRTQQPGTEAFAGLEDRAGGCAALWQTLRDLRDGMVDPQVAAEAIGDGLAARKGSERTAQLLLLLQTLSRFCVDAEINDQSDLDKFAARHAPASPFLAQFPQIFYYGFYDLTQVQIDFFHAVAQSFPTTLFFPLLRTRPNPPAWSFAERFYERHVQGLNSAPARERVAAEERAAPLAVTLFSDNDAAATPSLPGSWRCTIANAFGVHDEVAAAAKEILRLVDAGGLAFSDIGVIARSLEGYGAAIKEVFRDHHIPISGEIEEPLAQFPLTKAVILLLNLPAKNFLRSQVIDLLSSPYFNCPADAALARPDLWDLASRELAICKGVHEWRRLRQFTRRGIVISQPGGDNEAHVIKISAAHLECLADTVEALAADLSSLPAAASWSDFAEAWRQLVKKYLGITADADAPEPRAEASLNENILALLGQIATLDAVTDQVSSNDFSQTFQHWLERSIRAPSAAHADGVTVLNATAARGLSFRALFILGLNEGVFPRTIREDAFLRDRDRELLDCDLGFKVNPKLAAFDEEKLIFTLLVGAAQERLYCSFQRADEGGRALAPSWYLAELKRALGAAAERHFAEVTIPRSLREKSNTPPFHREDLLLPEELAIRLSLEAENPAALIEGFAAAPDLYKHGRKVIAELDHSGERLTGFDGAVGPLADYWRNVNRRGLSPTALETYARCPFQFFALHVLGLEPLERPEEISGPGPADFGELGHAIMKGVYSVLIDHGFFAGKRAAIDVDLTLAAEAERVCAEYESKNPVGYALTWGCFKEQLTQLLRRVIRLDLEEMAASGFTPASLETDMTDRLPLDWPEPVRGATIHGRLDRIDRGPQNHQLRVIDYKFKFGASQTAQDKDLERAALRGERLQPPFYSLLGERWASRQANQPPSVEARFYYIAPRWSDGPLVTAEFGSASLSGKVGAEIKKTIAQLSQGIYQGRFFIQRGEHCQHCEVAEICRKNHPPSLWRSENDPITRPHRELKEKDPKKL